MKQIHIGEIIKQRRLELKLTQEELCEGICEPPTMSRIEKGHQTPTHSKLKALLSRLGLPCEKYYAMLSDNELEIERLKDMIITYNSTNSVELGLQAIEILSKLISDDDHITQQFILRSMVMLGKIDSGSHTPYTTAERLDLLFKAITLTIPRFDIDEIGSHWYSLEELKIINLIATTYGDSGQLKIALDIYYLLMRYIRRKFVINNDNIPMITIITHNYSMYLLLEKRFNDAIKIAQQGLDYSVQWGRATHMGGLLYVLGEANYSLGNIELSKQNLIQSYYAYTLMRNTADSMIIRDYIKKYFNIDISNLTDNV